MRYLLTILMVLFFSQVSAQLKYVMSPGEYTAVFKKVSTGIAYTIGTDPSQLGGTGGVGTQGIPIEISTIPANKPMAGVCSGLHDFGTYSIDSGRVFMAGQANNCQLGNGTTTGPTNMYEILTDAGGNQFDSIAGMTAGWCISAAAPFYAAYKWYNAASTYNNAVYIWGNGSTVGLGSCIKPTATFVGGFGSGEVIQSISAQNSSIHCITTDGKLWVLGGTDDYPANTGTNSTPTTWTQVTLPGGQLASFMCKGNSFVFVISTTGHLISFGEYGWISENKSTNAFTPITTPTQVDSYFPSSIFPISQMVAAHTAYAILTTTNKLFTGGSNEIGICGTGSTIFWPTYTGTNGLAPYDWDVAMGEYVNQCTQIAKNANVTWSQIFGGPLYSFYFLAEDNNGNLYGAGRDKAGGIPDGEIPGDTTDNSGPGGTPPSLSANYNMSWNHLWFTSLPDPLTLTSSIVSTCPACATGYLSGSSASCQYAIDAPVRPNTNLHANLVLTPTAGGFNWSSSTSTTDGSHKIMWSQSFITQHSGTSIGLGVQGGESGSVTGIAAGTYVINDTIVDNAWDTAFTSQSVTVSTQTGWYFNTTGSDANATNSQSTPWVSAAKFNSIQSSLGVGDTVYFQRGQTFPGTWRLTASGIVWTDYGTGPDPVIGGMTPLTFSGSGSNFTAACSGCTASTNLFTMDTYPQVFGQTPNAPYQWITFIPGSSSTTTVYAPSFFATAPALTRVGVFSSAYTQDNAAVTAQTTSQITVSPALSYNNVGGNGFFYYSTPDTLGEWSYSGGAGGAITANSVSGHTCAAPSADTVIYVTGSNDKLSGIAVQGGNKGLVIANGYADSVVNDSLEYSGQDGIDGSGNRLYINGCWIKNIENSAIDQTATDTGWQIFNTTIKNVGMWRGMGQNGTAQMEGINAPGPMTVIRYLTSDSTGFNAIYTGRGDSTFVDSSHIHHCNLRLTDGAAVYAYRPSVVTPVYGDFCRAVFADFCGNSNALLGTTNTISSASYAFYADSHSNGWTVSGLVSINNLSGGVLNHGPGNAYSNLLVAGNGSGGFGFLNSEYSGGPTLTGVTLSNSTFYGTGTDVLVFNYTVNGDITTMLTSNGNKFYHGTSTTPFKTQSSTDGGTARTLASWVSNTGQDASSTFQGLKLSAFGNPAFSSATVHLPGVYTDITGVHYYYNFWNNAPELGGGLFLLVNYGNYWARKYRP
jgi:hypothetical protein